MTLGLDILRARRACTPGLAWAERWSGKPARDAWEACERGDWLLWVAAEMGVNRRVVVRAACTCARTALHLVPAGEERPRIAIETAERWTRGEATMEEVREAGYAAADAAASYAAADAAAASAAALAAASYAAAAASAAAAHSRGAASPTSALAAAALDAASALAAANRTDAAVAAANALLAVTGASLALARACALAHARALALAAAHAQHARIVRAIIPWDAVQRAAWPERDGFEGEVAI